MKTYLRRQSVFRTREKLQKYLTQFQNILAFSTMRYHQVESGIEQGIFLHATLNYIVSSLKVRILLEFSGWGHL